MSCIAPCRMPRGYGRLSNSFQHPTHVNLSQAHEKTEYPMLGFNYVSGIWQADGFRMASKLETGGTNVFHYQWLEGQDAYLVNLTM